jgi:exopolysaccharide production protein ExoZ
MGSPVKLRNVQALRAYGAFAVAYYHTGFSLGIGLGLPIGSFGVGIFFVISGFIMAMVCDTDSRHFLGRRIARIVPLYWILTLAVYLIASIAPGLLGSTSVGWNSLVRSLFFIPYQSRGTYFPILFLGWSLNYEMYFYVLIAAALWISKRYAPLIASGAMIAILLTLQVLQPGGAMMFYGHPIILLFVIGILLYYAFQAIPSEQILANKWTLIITGIAAALVMIITAINLIEWRNALIVGFTSSVLVFCAVLLDKANVSFRWPFLMLLGDASYAMYLVHPYCEEAINKFVARSIPILNSRTLVGMPISLTVTILASILVYRWLDNPLHIYFRNLFARKPKLPAVSPVAHPVSE